MLVRPNKMNTIALPAETSLTPRDTLPPCTAGSPPQHLKKKCIGAYLFFGEFISLVSPNRMNILLASTVYFTFVFYSFIYFCSYLGKAFRAGIRGSKDFFFFFSFLLFFYLTYSRWTSSLPSCLWSRRIFPSLPGSRLTIFYRDASSALLQVVNQRLNFTCLGVGACLKVNTRALGRGAFHKVDSIPLSLTSEHHRGSVVSLLGSPPRFPSYYIIEHASCILYKPSTPVNHYIYRISQTAPLIGTI